ncbi:hypothetical protein F183_A23110 [Bryobacterales bacterium F-183]|nr:hypothetical protein F183_A23110 [Bryobacterales bacterium F-183]
MLEVTVLSLFIFAAFAGSLLVNVLRVRRDERQEKALADLLAGCSGQPAVALVRLLGDPYEIEKAAPGRELYIWKFPPAVLLPRGRGLLILLATIDEGCLTSAKWKRQL